MYIDFKLEYDKVRDVSELIARLFKMYSKNAKSQHKQIPISLSKPFIPGKSIIHQLLTREINNQSFSVILELLTYFYLVNDT